MPGKMRRLKGISMDCLGLASGVQATTSGIIDVNGQKNPSTPGNRLSDGAPLTVYPGEVPHSFTVALSG
ncbi:YcjX family protein [Escherichia coli]